MEEIINQIIANRNYHMLSDKQVEEMKNKCKYCLEYNGDGIEETGGFDYYSCELKNKQDLNTYNQYSPVDNMVNIEDCKYYLCETCMLRNKVK